MEKALEMRPSTPSVRVIDLSWQGSLNPDPLIRDEEETLVDEYLSPTRLKALTGTEDLRDVTTLQMCVDTRDHTLGNFGTYMPNLRELKLNNSVILSLRDLGTSLSNLQVLWLARCGLTDLDGIASFFSLKELYLAYNDVADLSQVSMLEDLEVLDLEGNNIANVNELQYLALCGRLTSLNIEGNPVCVRPTPEDTEPPDYNYRATIKKMIPQIQFLDDVPAEQTKPATPQTPTQDWLMVKDSIKETTGSQVDAPLEASFQGLGTPLRKERPRTAQPGFTYRLLSAPRPSTARRPASSLRGGRAALAPETSGDNPSDDETSDLTHGIGKVICGNPIKALRTRKERLRSAPVSTPQSGSHEPEHTFDPVTSSPKDRDDVFAELKAWREKHNEVLKRIQEQRAPQVLTITHSDEDNGDSLSSSSDEEELEDPWNASCLIRVTPDTLSPSPQSPTSELGQMNLQDTPLYPSPPVTPCPPSLTTGASRVNKGADIRSKRLLRGSHRTGLAPRTPAGNACLGDEAFVLTESDDKCIRTITQAQMAESTMLPGRLSSGQSSSSVVHPRNTIRNPSPAIIPSHQPIIRSAAKTPERPSPPNTIRPATAKGILQRLPNRPILLTTSKTSNT